MFEQMWFLFNDVHSIVRETINGKYRTVGNFLKHEFQKLHTLILT